MTDETPPFDADPNDERSAVLPRSPTRRRLLALLAASPIPISAVEPALSFIAEQPHDSERGALGMHYTSVPNILKVLNPLFLDDLRASLEAAGDSTRKLRALRRRISAIRVFEPACGSGNFLVIAYIRLREIEHEIVQRTGDDSTSGIPLTNFYGIEIKGFPAEIARLALLIAEFQCDARLISQLAARSMVLPLHRTEQIHIGNALRLDWLVVCPPITQTVVEEHDLGGPTGRFALEDNWLGEAVEPETYICGNPPYIGSQVQGVSSKEDLQLIAASFIKKWKSLDYVAAWYLKAVAYMVDMQGAFAFVTTSSLCEGLQVSVLWPHIIGSHNEIFFAYRPFRWTNLAANNAGVTVVIVGVAKSKTRREKFIFQEGQAIVAHNINAYLLNATNVFVDSRPRAISDVFAMVMGAMPRDGGHLLFERSEARVLVFQWPATIKFLRQYVGSDELINGSNRECLWIEDQQEKKSNLFLLYFVDLNWCQSSGHKARLVQHSSSRLSHIGSYTLPDEPKN